MADVRVRLPLGAFENQGVGKLGNPSASGAEDRRFKSDHPDYAARGVSKDEMRNTPSLTRRAAKDHIAVGPVLGRAGAC